MQSRMDLNKLSVDNMKFKEWLEKIELHEKDNRGGNRYKGARSHLRRAFTQQVNFYKKPQGNPFVLFR